MRASRCRARAAAPPPGAPICLFVWRRAGEHVRLQRLRLEHLQHLRGPGVSVVRWLLYEQADWVAASRSCHGRSVLPGLTRQRVDIGFLPRASQILILVVYRVVVSEYDHACTRRFLIMVEPHNAQL